MRLDRAKQSGLLRRRAMRDLRELVEADLVCFGWPLVLDGVPRLTNARAMGSRDSLEGYLEGLRLHGKSYEAIVFASGLIEPVAEVDARREGHPLAPLLDDEGRSIELGQLVVHVGDEIVGWLGLARRDGSLAMGQQHRALLERIARRLGEAARLDRQLVIPEVGFGILDGSGQIVAADERFWSGFAGLDTSICSEAVEQIDGAMTGRVYCGASVFEVRRVVGEEGAPWFIARLASLEAMRRRPMASLTPTQRQVARLASTGRTNGEIAAHLDRSPETVKSHLSEIYRRLEISSRVELTRLLEEHL